MIIGYKSLTKKAVLLSIFTVPLISFFIFITENRVESLGDPLVSAIFAGFLSELVQVSYLGQEVPWEEQV